MVMSHIPTIQSSDGPILRRSAAISSCAENENGATKDAVSVEMQHTLGAVLAHVSDCYRGNVDLWLPDQGSNLGPAD